MSQPSDGLEVPLHRSLVEPMLMLGLPRTVALVLWTVIAAIGFGLRQVWVLPIGAALHAVCAAGAKADPFLFDVFVVALKIQRRLEP